MTNWSEIIGFSLGGAMLVMMQLGIAFTIFMPATNRWFKRYFVAEFSILFLCTVICFLALIVWNDPTKATESRIIYFLEAVFLSGLMYMPMIFLMRCCGEIIKNSLLFRINSGLLVLYLILLIVIQFTHAFYYVTPDNRFFRGPLWPLGMAPLVVMMILNIAGVIKRRNKLSKKYFIAFLVYLLPMTVAVFIHMFISVEMFLVFGMALFALVMFGLILSDNMEQYTRQQQEIAHQRAGIMVLQMRPHFICNTMMGIYYLCDQDPQKAKQVTLDFTTYLRKNFAAIASEEPIPFSEELEHTRAYLAVGQAQFEDVLFVSFDTPHTMFRIPPLTLQPIVENAVRHGMKSSRDPTHISVVTRQTASSSEIIVEDDGIGFDPSDDNEPHIALNNIRQRLEMMCKGELSITAREGGGTSVKVTIPISK